ncbi:MAG: hypothetical protein ACJA13_001024 [Paraglaciecola sp.]|jgi:hypothetical protein
MLTFALHTTPADWGKQISIVKVRTQEEWLYLGIPFNTRFFDFYCRAQV